MKMMIYGMILILKNSITDYNIREYSDKMKLINLLILSNLANAELDCYKLIGISKGETTKKIKSAYR